MPTGVTKGINLTPGDLDMMVKAYYDARGWTVEGLIPDSKLSELELMDIVKESVPNPKEINIDV